MDEKMSRIQTLLNEVFVLQKRIDCSLLLWGQGQQGEYSAKEAKQTKWTKWNKAGRFYGVLCFCNWRKSRLRGSERRQTQSKDEIWFNSSVSLISIRLLDVSKMWAPCTSSACSVRLAIPSVCSIHHWVSKLSARDSKSSLDVCSGNRWVGNACCPCLTSSGVLQRQWVEAFPGLVLQPGLRESQRRDWLWKDVKLSLLSHFQSQSRTAMTEGQRGVLLAQLTSAQSSSEHMGLDSTFMPLTRALRRLWDSRLQVRNHCTPSLLR